MTEGNTKHGQSLPKNEQNTSSQDSHKNDKKQNAQEPLRAEPVGQSPESEQEKNAPEAGLMEYINEEDSNAAKGLFKQLIQGMPKTHGTKNW